MSLQQAAEEQKGSDPTAMIRSRAEDFYKVLPAGIDRQAWLRMAESAVKRNPEVLNASKRNVGSLMLALLECARLGHMPGTDLFYLQVRSGAVAGSESWKGMVQRILRSGLYVRVVAEVVYAKEEFTFNPNTDDRPQHNVDYLKRNSADEPVMSYAYAVDHEGKASKVALCDPRYIAKVKAMSKGGVWAKWDEGMFTKTAVRVLVDYVQTSSGDRRDAEDKTEVTEENFLDNNTIIGGEVIE